MSSNNDICICTISMSPVLLLLPTICCGIGIPSFHFSAMTPFDFDQVFATWLMSLPSSSMPFSDKLLDKIQAKKKELEAQQQQMQAQGQTPNPMIAQAMGQGEAPAAPPQQ